MKEYQEDFYNEPSDKKEKSNLDDHDDLKFSQEIETDVYDSKYLRDYLISYLFTDNDNQTLAGYYTKALGAFFYSRGSDVILY